MPAPKGARPTHGSTKLARLRVSRDVSQERLADWMGIKSSTYWRLEHGLIAEPRLSWLVNAALFFDVALEDILEDAWLMWQTPPSEYADDEFRRYWGARASDVPTPLGRRRGERVRLTRSTETGAP